MGNALLEDLVGFEADGVVEILSFQKLIDARSSKGGTTSEVAAPVPFAITRDDKFQNVAPSISTVNVARSQGTPFQITELVKQEKLMIARVAEVTVIRHPFLFAMGRTDAWNPCRE